MIHLMRATQRMFSQIKDCIEGSINIVILPHIHPDGDTLGSALALKYALKSLDKNPYIVIDDEITNNLKFATTNELISKDDFMDLGLKVDLVISVDASDAERLGDRYNFINESLRTINIDHHKTNTEFCDINIVDENAAATGIIIYRILDELNIPITKKIAEAIYIAIVTDTGNFKYSNTDAETFLIAANLISKGIDNTNIINHLYQNRPIKELYLVRDALKQLTLYFDGKVSVIELTMEDFKRNEISPSNTEGIIETARDIEGVEVAIFIKEIEKNKVKVSLRSKNDIDVSELAQRFKGGGHSKAAGCSFNTTIEDARNTLLHALKETFE